MSDEHEDRTIAVRGSTPDDRAADRWEDPQIIDYGSLSDLTLSGMAPLTDNFMGSAGGS